VDAIPRKRFKAETSPVHISRLPQPPQPPQLSRNFIKKRSMDFVYEKTFESALFQELYDIAASKMISMDRSIGLAVLFSYDYMALFHRCLCCYFTKHEDFTETHDSYVSLKKKLV
jgi:hypothetical protein